MVKSKQTVISKKHEDRELATKAAFDATSIDIQSPHTMIVLLASKEDLVVIKALASLDKYASKLEQNALLLYEEGILKLLLPLLITNTEPFIRRFTVKLLSELTFQTQVADILLRDKLLEVIMEIMEGTEDFVVKEFCSSIVAELTITKAGISQLLSSNLTNVLNPHLSLQDPDIQKNCLQIIFNMIKDPYNHKFMTEDTNFNIKVFIDLLMSEYVAIQNIVLDILDLLTQRRKENPVSKAFQDAGGIIKLMALLKDYECKDIHSKCLTLLGNIYDNTDIAQNFIKDGVIQLFYYMDFINDPQLRRQAVEVIGKITHTPLGRKILTESGKVSLMAGMVLEQSAGMTAAVSSAIAGVVQDYGALQQILEQDTLRDLLTAMADEARNWDTRTAAVNAIYQILSRDYNSCAFVVDADKVEEFSKILISYNEKVPVNAAITTANCITLLATNADLKPRIISLDLISSLLHCFEDFKEDTMALKLAACETLCCLLNESEVREWLRALHGVPTVWAAITKHPNNIQFLQSAARFLHLCTANDKGFTVTLINIGALQWLLSQASLRHDCPEWEMALQSVFDKFLPIKFAMTGRLELTDITENNFYVTQVPLSRQQLDDNDFPILNDLMSNLSCPIHTLYFANFVDDSESREESMASVSFNSKLSKQGSVRSVHTQRESTSNPYINKVYTDCDWYLVKYIQSLRKTLSASGFAVQDSHWRGSVVDGDTVRQKALIVGEFVVKQMCGTDKTETCTYHSLALHISELKRELMNSIIPLGWIRGGMHLERAVLFKVLADRVGLPASLVRGKYKHRAWVEVAIPNLPPQPRPQYPNYLLKPNYVVDLMSSPVALHPLGSYEADLYCGLD